MPGHAPRASSGSTARGPTYRSTYKLSPTCMDLGWSHTGSLAVGLVSMNFYKLRPAVSVGFSIMILPYPLVHMVPSPSLHLSSRSSAQCLAVSHCISFFKLLAVGSIMIIRLITNLIKGESPFRLLSTIARSLSWGHTCGFLRISLTPGFSLTP